MSTPSDDMIKICDAHSSALTQHLIAVQHVLNNFIPFVGNIRQALEGLSLSSPLRIRDYSLEQFECSAEVAFTATSSFSDLLPYLEKLDRIGTLTSNDSSFAPMRIYTLSQPQPAASTLLTDLELTFIFKLYVHLPEGGTETCKVERIMPPETQYTPMPQYALVCKS